MSDIRDILTKLSLLEGSVTPAALPRHGLNQQQKSVQQMPALFKSKKISVLDNPDYPQHPAKGHFVGGESKDAHCDACDRLESECVCDAKDCDLTRQDEDVISTVRRGLNDYLKSIEDRLGQRDQELINKAKQNIQKDPVERLLPVKTIRTPDGHEIKIHGNEDDGFRITVNAKPLTSVFQDLDEAQLACDIFVARRQNAQQAQRQQPAPDVMVPDYIEER
jgi:hypothetical protein